MNARRRAGVPRQLLRRRESCDVTDLERDHDGEDEPHSGQRHEQLDLGCHLEHRAYALPEAAHAVVELLDLLEELLGGVGRVRGEEPQMLAKDLASRRSE
jgi:hypothetical protein